MVLKEEKQFEDPVHYAVPSAGINWGSLSEIKQKTNGGLIWEYFPG